jgi:Domain of unknown function (DUF4375)
VCFHGICGELLRCRHRLVKRLSNTSTVQRCLTLSSSTPPSGVEMEVNNGGFHQYFSNSTGDDWDIILWGG